MAIPVTCPSCRFEGEAPEETAGQTVLCPECKSNIPVPASRTSRSSDRIRNRPSDRPSRRPDDDDDDDDLDDRPSRRRSNRRRGGLGSVCQYCGSDAPPIYSSQISAAGWIVLVLMLVFCWPLFWIGLLIKEDVKKCSECGARL
jgi:hypothetical protein